MSMAMLRRERLAMGRLWRLKLEKQAGNRSEWRGDGRGIIAEITTIKR
jgi:hypothetical protein